MHLNGFEDDLFAIGGAGVSTLVAGGLITSGVGAPLGAALLLGDTILDSLNIGSGRTEADAIVPVQEAVGARLIEINNAIPTANVTALQNMHAETYALGSKFKQFVNDPRFVDGRASDQALDTIMPLIDGTNHAGQIVRADRGTMGSIERELMGIGPNVGPPLVTQGAGRPGLSYQFPGASYLPQAGYLPPVAPIPEALSNAGLSEVGGLSLPVVVAGGLALFLLTRGRGRG